jgi:hypothetical protein
MDVLDQEMKKRGFSLVGQDNVVQNYLLKQYRTKKLTLEEVCQEFDRLEFYARNCLGTLRPSGLSSWLEHCATDTTIQSFDEYSLLVRETLSVALVVYRGNLIADIQHVYKGHAMITEEQYKWARTLALNESLSTFEGTARVLEACEKERDAYFKHLPLPRELQQIVAEYAVDCLAYLRLHLPEKIAIEESTLCLGFTGWNPLVPEKVKASKKVYLWSQTLPDQVVVVRHPLRHCGVRRHAVSTFYGCSRKQGVD